MILTEHIGFVWSCEDKDIIIQLCGGGKIRTKNPGTFDTGDKVSVIPDTSDKRIIQVLSLEEAEHAVRIGIDPFYASYNQEPEELPLDEEEIFNDVECGEDNDIHGIV